MTEANSTTDLDIGTPTAPASFMVSARAFASEEQARSLAGAVGESVRLLSCNFDLSGLDGVTVAYDYPQALLDLDRGYQSKHQLTSSDGLAVGVAMTPSVLRAGALKSHIVFNAAFVAGIEDAKHENYRFALHLIAHECAHAEITRKFDAAFPGVLLRQSHADSRTHYRWDCILACWDEYAATRLSAEFGEDPTDGYERTFLGHLAQARNVANDRIKAYRIHHKLDQVLAEVYSEYGNLLKFAAYHLGNLDGHGVDPGDRPETAAALREHWFAPYFELLHTRCRAIAEGYGRWNDMRSFDLIGDLLEDVLAAGGLHFSQTPDGRLQVNIPFTAETMPG
ncbi:hypothetical protein VAR608DRAFT_0545 [Variovorax sp. HW608]|uniref:hypothetical protein n=1 Tax=Variovorax sp. HW608 TaxID=1034889 RepID=UPI00081F7CD6|nr:hypothetical protein [Variovorax sp. HW608]SCK11151.1 hypothetical protein VAR608DRAFT_0545 [Variovorax sp. HW608]